MRDCNSNNGTNLLLYGSYWISLSELTSGRNMLRKYQLLNTFYLALYNYYNSSNKPKKSGKWLVHQTKKNLKNSYSFSMWIPGTQNEKSGFPDLPGIHSSLFGTFITWWSACDTLHTETALTCLCHSLFVINQCKCE